MQLVTRPHQRNSPWGAHNVMKRSSHTHFSGSQTSQLTADYMPKALSCLPSTQRLWSLTSLAALLHRVSVPKKQQKNFPHQAWYRFLSAATKHWGERWEANTVCLRFTDKTEHSHRRPYHNNLHWFSHNSLAADGSNLLQLRRGGLCSMLW